MSSPRVIVSITSIQARLPDLPRCLESLLQQDFKDFEIHLYLSHEAYLQDAGVSVAEAEKIQSAFADPRLKIKFTKNIGPYRKIIPVLSEGLNSTMPIVTADDDVIYPTTWLSGLVRSSQSFPGHIVCYRARCIFRCSRTTLSPYVSWPVVKAQSYFFFKRHRLALLPTGVGGVLYPPNIFSAAILDPRLIELAPTSDDLMLKFFALAEQIPVAIVEPVVIHNDHEVFKHIPSTANLFSVNRGISNLNDINAQKLLEYLFRTKQLDLKKFYKIPSFGTYKIFKLFSNMRSIFRRSKNFF